MFNNLYSSSWQTSTSSAFSLGLTDWRDLLSHQPLSLYVYMHLCIFRNWKPFGYIRTQYLFSSFLLFRLVDYFCIFFISFQKELLDKSGTEYGANVSCSIYCLMHSLNVSQLTQNGCMQNSTLAPPPSHKKPCRWPLPSTRFAKPAHSSTGSSLPGYN